MPELIVIQPYDSTEVEILYTPAELDASETGEIIFETAEIGSWRFIAYGSGQPPTNFKEKLVTCMLNNDYSGTV